ncbi:hypothetical protein HELRODRAFT_161971 [Helobdella robusta]|uniref:Uncharacterized protein n=1 Tax=Helobdella robusta TaxID=6412 RepID=T1ES39_HELRO|nr:hypothetical protein HELRODRAFT_161971 [Helobdella robusta]ESO02679.1 hypothetical protein HELRODRAFT_161971 [Helobdella robusta]
MAVVANDDIIITKPVDCSDDVSVECEEDQLMQNDERLIYPVPSSRNRKKNFRETTASVVDVPESSGNLEDDDDGDDDEEDGDEEDEEEEEEEEDGEEEDEEEEDDDADDEAVGTSENDERNANINMNGNRGGGVGRTDGVTKASTNQIRPAGQKNSTKSKPNSPNENRPHRRPSATPTTTSSSSVVALPASTANAATKKPPMSPPFTHPLPHTSNGYVYSHKPQYYPMNSQQNPGDFSSLYPDKKERNGPNQTAINMNIILIAGIAAGIVVLLFILVVAACKFYASSSGAAAAKALNDYQRAAGKSAYAYEACNTGAKCSSPLLAPVSQQSLPAVNALAQADTSGAVVGAPNCAISGVVVLSGAGGQVVFLSPPRKM